jgi:hypothetical protein
MARLMRVQMDVGREVVIGKGVMRESVEDYSFGSGVEVFGFLVM